ncbi:MAG: hypothetical protein ABSE63_09115, partial [Thermoguttaceae bacterium]
LFQRFVRIGHQDPSLFRDIVDARQATGMLVLGFDLPFSRKPLAVSREYDKPLAVLRFSNQPLAVSRYAK